MANKFNDVYKFFEEALSCNSENKTIKELTELLNRGTEIRLHPDGLRFIERMTVKQQGINHLSRLIDIKTIRNRFIINLIVGFVGVLIGAAVSIVAGLIKASPPC